MYQKDGFIIGGRVKLWRIDAILQSLEDFKRAKSVYFSQATHRYVLAATDEYGYLTESIEGVSRLRGNDGLGKSVESVLCSQEVMKALQQTIPSESGYVIHQSMLFDKSMETIDHIDSWYLDTDPKGGLVGVWIALEDIKRECGPFHVYEGSHREVDAYALQEENHEEFKKSIEELKDESRLKELTIPKAR